MADEASVAKSSAVAARDRLSNKGVALRLSRSHSSIGYAEPRRSMRRTSIPTGRNGSGRAAATEEWRAVRRSSSEDGDECNSSGPPATRIEPWLCSIGQLHLGAESHRIASDRIGVARAVQRAPRDRHLRVCGRGCLPVLLPVGAVLLTIELCDLLCADGVGAEVELLQRLERRLGVLHAGLHLVATGALLA